MGAGAGGSVSPRAAKFCSGVLLLIERMYRAPDIPAIIIFKMLNKLVFLWLQSYSMMQVSYPYKRLQSWRYGFVSDGKRKIQKIVDFIPIDKGNIVSLGFGDLLPDGSIDDKANSNNGDIVKVLVTVVDILKDFTSLYPSTQVFFVGSTDERTKLYSRILKVYHAEFGKEFAILGALMMQGRLHYAPYEPNSDKEYLAFIIKRIY
jgi:hypothetical protein